MEERKVGEACSNPFCEGEYVRNPKTGKVFCNKKCWAQTPPAHEPQPAFPEETKAEPERNPRLERIAILKSMIESGKTPLECNTLLPTYLEILDGTYEEK